VRRFLRKHLGSLALPSPNNPRFDTRRPPDEFTALGRDTSAADIAAQRQMLGVIVKRSLPRHTPTSLKHGKRIVQQKLKSGDIPNRDFSCEMHL
jgi:hypothetical protein